MHLEPQPLPVDAMTWTALLGRWLDFARSSVALPKDVTGQRWRQSVAPIITLQAVTFALRQLDDLPEDERALGLDRAEILIRRESRNLNETWRGEAMPELLLELMSDARLALRSATIGAAVELAVLETQRPGPFDPDSCRAIPPYGEAIRAIDGSDFDGEIHLVTPGTLLAPGEVLGFLIGRTPRAWRRERRNAAEALKRSLPALAQALAPFLARHVDSPRQAYRQLDAQGRISADVLASLVGDPLAGEPLLARVWSNGAGQVPLVDAAQREAHQRRAWPARGLTFTVSDGAAETRGR